MFHGNGHSSVKCDLHHLYYHHHHRLFLTRDFSWANALSFCVDVGTEASTHFVGMSQQQQWNSWAYSFVSYFFFCSEALICV